MIPGIKCNLGGVEYEIPPLTTGQLRNGVLKLMEENDELIQADPPKYIEALIVKTKIIGVAIRRNYPELDDEQLFNIIDMRNYVNAWQIVLGGSGLGEGQGAGSTSETPSPTPTHGTSNLSTEA